MNEKKPKRSRDIGDRPRPVAPVSTLYMFTDKQTGESGLVWGTRIEIEVIQGLPRYQDSGKVPFPIKVKSIGHVIPVTMPVRHHPMMVDDYDEWITPEKGYEVVDEQEGWQIHPPKSQLIVGEEELKLEAAGSLRLQMDSRKDDGIRHLYFQVLEGDPKLIVRFMVGEDTLIGSTMSHRTADGGEYSMYNCKLITPITVDDTPARLRHGCIEYDVIEEASNFRKAIEECNRQLEHSKDLRQAAVARQAFDVAVQHRDFEDAQRAEIKRLRDELVEQIYEVKT